MRMLISFRTREALICLLVMVLDIILADQSSRVMHRPHHAREPFYTDICRSLELEFK